MSRAPEEETGSLADTCRREHTSALACSASSTPAKKQVTASDGLLKVLGQNPVPWYVASLSQLHGSGLLKMMSLCCLRRRSAGTLLRRLSGPEMSARDETLESVYA